MLRLDEIKAKSNTNFGRNVLKVSETVESYEPQAVLDPDPSHRTMQKALIVDRLIIIKNHGRASSISYEIFS